MAEKHHHPAVRKVETQAEFERLLKLWLATNPDKRVWIDDGDQLLLGVTTNEKEFTTHGFEIESRNLNQIVD